MPIAASCPCGRKIKVADKMAGKRVACPECGKPILVPAADAPEPEMAAVVAEERSPAGAESEAPEPDALPAEAPVPTKRRGGASRSGVTTATRRATKGSGRASGRARAIEKPEGRGGLSSSAKGAVAGGAIGCVILGAFVAVLLVLRRGEPGTTAAGPEAAASDGTGGNANPGEPRTVMEWGEIFREYSGSVVIIHSESGDGSGFFVDERGVVCTNFHVVADAFVEKGIEIRVFEKGEDGEATARTYQQVSPVYLDAATDIALLRIHDEGAGPFKPVVLHQDDKYGTGDDIGVIGSPGAAGGERVLENTFTRGMISQARRHNLGSDHIQIGVPINKGNSGGPVFNKRGEVIGMATWGYEGKQDLNFAVPVSAVRAALADRTKWVQEAGESEVDAVRGRIEGFWKGLAADDGDAVGSFLPDYLSTRHLDGFQELVYSWKAYVDRMGMSQERLLERFDRRGKTECWLMTQVVFAHADEKEMKIKPAEVAKFYVDLQLKIWKDSGYQEFEIGNVELVGAMGKFEITISSKDAKSGRTTKETDTRYVFKDRGVWKFYAAPLEMDDISPY